MSDDGVTNRERGDADDGGDADRPGTGGNGDTPRGTDRVSRAELDELRAELDRLEDHLEDRTVERDELDDFAEDLEDRTVHRDEVEADLRRYVRQRVRRGHARGWGPYLVLLYGTVMTLGAFFFLGGIFAILAMLVIWLSTLGLYALMVLVGLTSAAVAAPGRLLDRLRSLR